MSCGINGNRWVINMDKIEKIEKAIKNIKPDAHFSWFGTDITTEEEFNNIDWCTGVNPNGTSILTKTNPHTELTWSTFSAEMDRLQTEYDAQDYARKRKAEYPSIEELVVALYDTEDKAAIEAKRAEVKAKYPK